MTKEEKAKDYVAKMVMRDGSDAWLDGDLEDAFKAGYDTAQKEVFDDILEHNKDVLERLKNNVPPPSALTWQDIRLIVQLADNILEATDKKELLAFGAEGYYRTVRERFIKYKEQEMNKGTDK